MERERGLYLKSKVDFQSQASSIFGHQIETKLINVNHKERNAYMIWSIHIHLFIRNTLIRHLVSKVMWVKIIVDTMLYNH